MQVRKTEIVIPFLHTPPPDTKEQYQVIPLGRYHDFEKYWLAGDGGFYYHDILNEIFFVSDYGISYSLGIHRWHDWKAGKGGVYLRDADKVFFVNNNGIKSKQLVLTWKTFKPIPFGDYGRDGNNFFLEQNGERNPLGMYAFDTWKPGVDRLYIQEANKFSCVMNDKTIQGLGTHQFNGWWPSTSGIYLRLCYDFSLIIP